MDTKDFTRLIELFLRVYKGKQERLIIDSDGSIVLTYDTGNPQCLWETPAQGIKGLGGHQDGDIVCPQCNHNIFKVNWRTARYVVGGVLTLVCDSCALSFVVYDDEGYSVGGQREH